MTANGNKRSATAFRDAVDSSYLSKQLGEKGMPEYTNIGLGSNVLALSQLVRGGDPQTLMDEIMANGSTNDVADMIVLLFASRNCRGGKGEKKLAFDMFLRFWQEYPTTGKALLGLFPHYGYWKDLLLLMEQAQDEPWFSYNEDLIQTSMTVMREQLDKDLAALETYRVDLKMAIDEDKIKELQKSGPKISLLAKWLPRENHSFDKKVDFVPRFATEMFPNAQTKNGSWESAAKARYRRVVAELTSFLALPEVLLAAQREDEIRFGAVASKATMRLRKVFLNEAKDGSVRSENPKRIRLAERFAKHVVEKGLKGAQLMPHEIVEKILGNRSISKMEELVLDAQWKDLWRNVVKQVEAKAAEDGADFNPTSMVPLCDVSGSMYGLPMHVAIALSIGISEITHEAFRHRILTFESNPRWHRLNAGDSIVKKVRSLAVAPWGGSTNFEAAYDLILGVVESAKLAKEDVPSLIVFSDMQFDEAGGYSSGYYGYSHGSRVGTGLATMHDVIRRKVARVASRLGWDEADSEPTPMVYWNLRNTGGHPVDKDTEGTVLLAGFSPSLLKLVMYGEALREEEVEIVKADGTVVTKKVRVTPEEILRRMLDDKLYDPVREVLVASREKKLQEYELPL